MAPRRRVLAVVAVLLVVACGRVQAQDGGLRSHTHGYVTVGVSLWYPPFGFPLATGGWSGLDVAFAHDLATVMFGDPSNVRLLPLSPGDRLAALDAGEVDVVAAGFSHPSNTMAGVILVGPYFSAPMAVATRIGTVHDWADLDGELVAYMVGTNPRSALAAVLPQGVHPVYVAFASLAAAVHDVTLGRIAALVGPEPTIEALVERDSGLASRNLPTSVPREQFWVMVRPGDSALVHSVHEAIARLPQGPALQTAIAAWNREALGSTPPL